MGPSGMGERLTTTRCGKMGGVVYARDLIDPQ